MWNPEVFALGGMCPMAEGRCSISSYATGKSPVITGVFWPPSHVRYEQSGDNLLVREGAFVVDSVPNAASAGYSNICKGCFAAADRTLHLFETRSV